MKVLAVCEVDLERHPGPAEHLFGALEALQRRGHQVTLLAPSAGKPPRDKSGVRVRYLYSPRWRWLGPLSYQVLLAVYFPLRCLFDRPEVCYLRTSHYLLSPVWWCRLLGVPLVAEVNSAVIRHLEGLARSRLLRGVVAFIERQSFRAAGQILCVSAPVKEEIAARYKLPAEKLAVIPNAADPEVFRPLPGERRAAARRKYGLPEEIPLCGFVGALEWWQNLEPLLDAARLLGEKAPAARIVIAGDGSAREGLESQAPANVIFTGALPRQEVPEFLGMLDIGLLCKRPESPTGSSLKLFQYLACGLPVACALSHEGEFVREQGLGLTFPAGDAEALAEGLARLLADPRRREYGRRGRRLVEMEFNWDRVAEKTEKLLLAVREKKP